MRLRTNFISVLTTLLAIVGVSFHVGPEMAKGWTGPPDHRDVKPLDNAGSSGESTHAGAPTTSPSAEPKEFEGEAAVLKLDVETQHRIGLKAEPVKAVALRPQITAYGAVEEDPAASYTLRAGYAGYLRSDENVAWPRLGQHIRARTRVASLHLRLSAMERLEIQSRRLEAQSEIDALKAELESARASFENKKNLNEHGKVVSDRAMEEAETMVRVEEVKLSAAQKRKSLFDQAAESESSDDDIPVLVEVEGNVVQLLAQPGEAVEAGQPLMRVARLDRLIARIDLPLGARPREIDTTASIILFSGEPSVLAGVLLGPASAVGNQTKGTSLLYGLTVPEGELLPGAPVQAVLFHGGHPRSGVLVPREALLRFAGSARVYIQTGEEEFEARDIVPQYPTPDGWFVLSGIKPGERIVTTGAQLMLSEQLKSQIELEEAAEE